ncbi:acyl-CoA dehydrogenase family protein [Pseudorhodoferax soli]|uniref:Alkylation response protein AidB-like acyl-CoA dehydrogenase n=1 Tax=Pseudorhodoferax soli TaxID=545864 RepID=A0A368X8T3_9BURK|nr:acyl-CoA dehydrogenase [Pseudorhodoferax soli]RCW63616.1 alkylation response protein AidB-like acyl-CoA dehydrogenase [Pseudorhodoferax soli]
MDFEFSYERKALAESIARFARDNLSTPSHRSKQFGSTAAKTQGWRSLAEIGAVGALFQQDVGGFGDDTFDVVNVFEALGRELVVDLPFLGALMAGQVLASTPATHPVLDKLVSGEQVVTLAHCEPGALWEPSYVTACAQQRSGAWVLDGIKAAVPNAQDAQHFVVSARTAGASADEDGITPFLVDASAEGLRVRPYPEIDGGRAGEVVLESVVVADSARIGPVHEGHTALQQAIAAGTLAISAQAVGAMDQLVQATTEYLKVRKQFGAPIGANQALQHRIVEMMLELEKARSAVINAAALSGSAQLQAISAAKLTANQAARRIAEEAIQLHGGIGMTWELEPAHYASWLSMLSSRLGDDDVHLDRYVALAETVTA